MSDGVEPARNLTESPYSQAWRNGVAGSEATVPATPSAPSNPLCPCLSAVPPAAELRTGTSAVSVALIAIGQAADRPCAVGPSELIPA